eukprot:352454-Chlamydomonas_euryale.AAC.17
MELQTGHPGTYAPDSTLPLVMHRAMPAPHLHQVALLDVHGHLDGVAIMVHLGMLPLLAAADLNLVAVRASDGERAARHRSTAGSSCAERESAVSGQHRGHSCCGWTRQSAEHAERSLHHGGLWLRSWKSSPFHT